MSSKYLSEEARQAMKRLRREIECNPRFSGGPLILRLNRIELMTALRKPPFVLHERLKSISGIAHNRTKDQANVLMEGVFRDLITVLGTDAGTSRDEEDNSLLHHVVHTGNKKVLEMLIDAGAELDQQNKKGETSLEMSILSSSPALFRLLCNLGCDRFQHVAPIQYQYGLLRQSNMGAEFQELALEATMKIVTVFNEAVSNFCKKEVASMVDLSPVITIPFCPDPENYNTHKCIQIEMSLDAIHTEDCCIRNAIVVLPMKYIEEENKYIVLENPGPIYKTPTITPIGGKIYRLPDMSRQNNHLGVAAGRFFYCPHLQRENVLTIRIAANQLQRCFLGVKLFQFHVATRRPSYCKLQLARHPGSGNQEFGQCGGGRATYRRVLPIN